MKWNENKKEKKQHWDFYLSQQLLHITSSCNLNISINCCYFRNLLNRRKLSLNWSMVYDSCAYTNKLILCTTICIEHWALYTWKVIIMANPPIIQNNTTKCATRCFQWYCHLLTVKLNWKIKFMRCINKRERMNKVMNMQQEQQNLYRR